MTAAQVLSPARRCGGVFHLPRLSLAPVFAPRIDLTDSRLLQPEGGAIAPMNTLPPISLYPSISQKARVPSFRTAFRDGHPSTAYKTLLSSPASRSGQGWLDNAANLDSRVQAWF
jgi:hypothetical protein